jgi:hypothetical protein
LFIYLDQKFVHLSTVGSYPTKRIKLVFPSSGR